MNGVERIADGVLRVPMSVTADDGTVIDGYVEVHRDDEPEEYAGWERILERQEEDRRRSRFVDDDPRGLIIHRLPDGQEPDDEEDADG